MIYAWDITTEAAITQPNAMRTALKVTKGLVYRVEIEFPPGPLGLCHVSLWDGGYQVWPSNPDFDFHGDNGYITFEETYLKLIEPFEFTARTWNEDDTYAHQIHVRLGMVSSEIYMARFLPSLSYDKMLQVMRELQEQQDVERETLIAAPLPWKGE